MEPQFERTVTDQIDFLTRNLVGGDRAAALAALDRLGRPAALAGPASPPARSSLPRAMTSLKLRTRKMKNSAAKPTANVNAPIAICWPTE